jgi:hypothetical protein
MSMRLKRVWLTADGIRASSYFRTAYIAWPDVRRVVIHGDFGHRRTPLVELELWKPHPFGRRIPLLPVSNDLLTELPGKAAGARVNVEHRPA